ncbi:hypothetical protein ACWEDZ_19945 [Streptomyces sp. NPDC005047]
MDLTVRILRAALARPAVLMAVCPGATEARLRMEQELRERGWPMAAGPATANVLAVVGSPDPDDAQWAEELWAAIPAPRARIHLTTAQDVGASLDEVASALLRTPPIGPPPMATDRAHSASDPPPDHHPAADGREPHPGLSESGPVASSEPHEHPGEPAVRSAQADHGGHSGHDMEMQIAGLPMAGRADDRDGLRLDQLHLALGPALLDWPTGLVLRLALQGDVIQRAHVEQTRVRPSPALPFWDEPWLRAAAGEQVSRGQAARRLCAAHLDSVGRLLAVAGWQAEARRARVARDVALAGRPADDVVAALRQLVRRVGRSRTLRWLTVDLGELSTEAAATAGLSGPTLAAGGDVWDRLTLWLEEAACSAALCDKTESLDTARLQQGPRGTVGGAAPPSRALLDVLPRLLEGAEFAGARLIVASLDPDLDEFVPSSVGAEVPHG